MKKTYDYHRHKLYFFASSRLSFPDYIFSSIKHVIAIIDNTAIINIVSIIEGRNCNDKPAKQKG